MPTIQCTVNGRPVMWEAAPGATLLEMLRAEGLTSVKEGCGVGECGACTVLVNNKAINACLFLAMKAEGTHIRTTEGECANNTLSHFQNALIEEGAVQCGFCTPGIVMAGTAFLEDCAGKEVKPSREEIRHALSGNLCRCTGYEPVVNAVEKCLK